jgi:hypothetical protein
MCFSATASFVTAGVTGAIGIVSIGRARELRELPLAAAPLIFALQQSAEGFLWLTLSHSPVGPPVSGLTFLFLMFAEVLWPVYAPLAVLLIETNETRRQLMRLCLAVGVSLSLYLFWSIVSQPQSAAVLRDHIVYVSEFRHSDLIGLCYLTATALPLVLSSRRTVVVLGAIVLVGSITAYSFYWEAFVSVWCFFAAAASGVILAHFEWSRRLARVAGV